ncbi:hypothetical protein SVIO_079440 [Streptomyces violaceusniger]|uniref:Uncharacterized protein n=1 Tax=Streptomyces violaceusniger TaxID=68280 RepID=A0A4D4L6V0_STRVO|nr:hypothetical protein SVIO_079440 [Streptomyces violaceusniger]
MPPLSHPPEGVLRRGRGQVRLDTGRRGAQRREELAAGALGGAATGVGGHVERGHHASARVPHGHGERPQPLLQLLIDQGVPLLRRALHDPRQFGHVGHGVPGQRLRPHPGEVGGAGVGVQAREQHPAHGGGVGGEAGADGDVDAHDADGGDARDVADVAAVEDGQGRRLMDGADQFAHVRLGDVGEAELREGA